MRRLLPLFLLVSAIPAFGQTQTVCRDLKDSGGYLYQGETVINSQACRQVTYAPVAQAALVTTSAPAAAAPAASAPVVSNPTQPAPASTAAASGASEARRQCLIVTSAEGHRFRNSMIAGVLTGGIGLAAGAAFSGGRYEYRDSYNLPPSDVKTKYKGPELQSLVQRGVHVVVVNKKDKSGSEVNEARASCQQ